MGEKVGNSLSAWRNCNACDMSLNFPIIFILTKSISKICQQFRISLNSETTNVQDLYCHLAKLEKTFKTFFFSSFFSIASPSTKKQPLYSLKKTQGEKKAQENQNPRQHPKRERTFEKGEENWVKIINFPFLHSARRWDVKGVEQKGMKNSTTEEIFFLLRLCWCRKFCFSQNVFHALV